MNEKETIKDVAETVANHLPKTVAAADGVLSSIVGILDVLLTPFQALKVYKDAKLDDFKRGLIEKTNKIPEDRRKTEVDLNIVGPALEALKYTIMEDDLREMFENLLASSIDKQSVVFPSFVDIIRQLSSDEAKLLKYLSDHGDGYPLIELRLLYPDKKSYNIVLSNFSDIGYGVVERPDLLEAYLNDLERFGLIVMRDGVYLRDESQYQRLENHEVVQNAKSLYQNSARKMETRKKSFSITHYGQSFITSCVISK